MSRFRMFVPIAAIIALLVVAPAFAAQEGGARRGGQGRQGRGMFGARPMGFGGRMVSMVMLVGSDQVRKELKVTEEQATKIDEIVAAYREESRGLFSGRNMRDLTPEERQKAREEMTKKREELTKKTDAKLVAAMKKEQVKRLNEIMLQQQGVEGLTSKYVVEGLKLSKEQVEKIKAAFKTRDDEMQKLMADMRAARGQGGDRSGFEEMREKMDAIRKKGEETALAVLSKEQKEGLEKLKGEKFELDRSSFRRMGPGGRRGGGEGAPGGERRKRRPQGGEGGGEAI